MPEDKMLREALDALAQGQKPRARDLLTRLLRADQANPTYWLYMSAVVETSKERIYCLQNVLRLDPNNKQAQLGLVIQGAGTPRPGSATGPLVRRSWDIPESARRAVSPGKRLGRILAFGGAGALLVGLLLMGILGPQFRVGGIFGPPRLTVTPQFLAQQPTPTLLPTNTPFRVTASPTFVGPTPLWMLLEATYTPTPLYVNTPHPISEAFRAGLRSLNNGSYSDMLKYMQQAAREEPQSADAQYYVGEALRLLGTPEEAMVAYDGAIATNPGFAPAYLGLARANYSLDRLNKVEAQLAQAIEADPNLVEAYLELAAYQLETGQPEPSLETLDPLDALAPHSPLLYRYRAEAYNALGEFSRALGEAQRAYELDRTDLRVYLLLGRAFLETGNPEEAKPYLNIFLSFEGEDFQALAARGQASFELGDFEAAKEDLTKVLAVDPEFFPALLYRGLAHLELEDGQAAVNDLFAARNLDRSSFAASLGLGRALFLTDRLGDSISQFTGSAELAGDENQLAEVYYWRATAREAIGDWNLAIVDWTSLLDLPAAAMDSSWRELAKEKIIALAPSPTATLTHATATAALTASKTLTPAP
jgi:tetratricopeptide (TPR) repeat protein